MAILFMIEPRSPAARGAYKEGHEDKRRIRFE
jgi:hypothetical protein